MCVPFNTLFCLFGSAVYEDLEDKGNGAVYVICLKKICDHITVVEIMTFVS